MNEFLVALRDSVGTAVVFALIYGVLRLARPDVMNHSTRTLVVGFAVMILASTAYTLVRQSL